MRQAMAAVPALTVGLDVSDRYSRMCGLDREGEVVEEGRVRTTPEALRLRFGGLSRARVVLEVGTHSPWASRLLEELGHEVVVANPRKLRLIYANHRKGDGTDAEYLARVGRLDPKLLAPIQHRREEAQADLAVVRARSVLVRSRSRLVSHVRGAVKAVGGRVPRCSTEAFHQVAAEALPEELGPALSPLLETIHRLTREIRRYDRKAERLCEEIYPETALLRQVAGVGPITALCYVLVIEDPGRFEKSRAVGPYLGLVPRRDDSGDSEPELRISKAGDPLLRSLLVQAAHYILGPFGPDTDLRRWGLEIAARGGRKAKKRATVAVARKLAVLLHVLWVSAAEYEPLRHSQTANAAA